MAVQKIQNIVATVGEYQNSQWETKKKYHIMWSLITKDDWQKFIKIDSIPVGREWYASIYDRKEKDDQKPATTQTTTQPLSGDLPF